MSSKPKANPFPDLAAPPRKSKTPAVDPSSQNNAADRKESKPRAAVFGMFKRKEKWTLSARGWLVAMAAVLILAWAVVLWIHPFLAVTDRVDTQCLVVEGWVPNYALEESIAEFKSRPYTMMFTVGTDPTTGVNIEPGDSRAFEAFKRLKWLGMNPDLVTPVPAHVKYRDRTYQSALALRKWIEEHHLPVTSFNVVTVGAHARRSRLLFQEAFEGKARVGIISVVDREYDQNRWWKYSEGVREVIGEGLAYIYARFIFHPGNP